MDKAVGDDVDAAVGDGVGLAVGDGVDTAVGNVGNAEGVRVRVGLAVGFLVYFIVGDRVRFGDGVLVGPGVGFGMHPFLLLFGISPTGHSQHSRTCVGP